mgnify:CR=1 FL=1
MRELETGRSIGLLVDQRVDSGVPVPFFGIEEQGVGNYLKSYMRPTLIMLPFNIISELSRTLALQGTRESLDLRASYHSLPTLRLDVDRLQAEAILPDHAIDAFVAAPAG